MVTMFDTIKNVQQALLEHYYVADRGLATAIYLSIKLGKPLFLEGEAGVGKTEVGKVLAGMLDTRRWPPAGAGAGSGARSPTRTRRCERPALRSTEDE